jgi:hypothetical protein
LIIRGIDPLGQPFEERTATLDLNLHGCRYASKHHLMKNTWVTLELARGSELHNVRARVASVQRPHSVREYFQIAVELESPSNIWGFNPVPSDWEAAAASLRSHEDSSAREHPANAKHSEEEPAPITLASYLEKLKADIMNTTPDSIAAPEPSLGLHPETGTENPLLRELNAQLERKAKQTIETAVIEASEQIRRAAEEAEQKHAATAEQFYRRWKEEFEAAQDNAREQFSNHLAAKQAEFLHGLQSELEGNFGRARQLLDDLDRRTQMLRAENEAASEMTSRVAQAHLQMEALEASRTAQPVTEPGPSKAEIAATEEAVASWRRRLLSEMELSQAQWNELLQSSLDSGVQRLAEQFAVRFEDVLRRAEQGISERLAELRQPLAQFSSEACDALANMKSALEHEVTNARSLLAKMEHRANLMKEQPAQLEAASRGVLDELRRRLDDVLEAQTQEMSERAEAAVSGASERVSSALDSLSRQIAERTAAEAESKLAPHTERIPALLRELSARAGQAEEGLRLHRERLRQIAENSQREVSSYLDSTLAELRNDFEAARKEALAKWNEELDASGTRASHATAESISRTSEWFQQEAQARLQVLVEQKLASAGTGYEEKIREAVDKFAAQLEDQASAHLAENHQKLDEVAGEVAGRTRTELGVAAEAAAASFGQVLHSISDLGVQQFKDASHSAFEQRTQELQDSAFLTLRNLEASGLASLERMQAQMGSQLESQVAEGRSALASEITRALDGLHAKGDALQKEWSERLDRLSDDAVAKHQERLNIATDSWMASSVHRLNERGQNTMEALTRSVDQALRESCSQLFDRVAEILRDRTTSAASVTGFNPAPSHDAAEIPTPHNEKTPSSND